MIDRSAGLNDRLVSAWQFAEAGFTTPAHTLAIMDAAGRVRHLDTTAHVSVAPLVFPWRALGLVAGAKRVHPDPILRPHTGRRSEHDLRG